MPLVKLLEIAGSGRGWNGRPVGMIVDVSPGQAAELFRRKAAEPIEEPAETECLVPAAPKTGGWTRKRK